MLFLYIIFSIGLCLMGIKLASEWELLEYFRWYRQLKFACQTVGGILHRLAKMKDPQAAATCIFNSTELSASIVYSRAGKDRILNIPYNKKLKMAMTPYKVLLVVNGTNYQDITQEPGMPYLCTARQLGGQKIIATNKLDEKTLTFSDDIAPGYLGLERLVLMCDKIDTANI